MIGLIVLLVVAFITLLIQFAPSIYGRLTASQITNLTYGHTSYTKKQTLCLLPLCTYTPHYNYRASGSQKDIANSIIAELKQMGYSLQNQSDNERAYQADIRCYGGRAHPPGDEYYFEKPTNEFYTLPGEDERRQVTEDVIVTFYADQSLGEVSTNDVGCHRPNASYRVELIFLERYAYGI